MKNQEKKKKKKKKNLNENPTWKTASIAFPKSSKFDLGGGILCAKLKSKS